MNDVAFVLKIFPSESKVKMPYSSLLFSGVTFTDTPGFEVLAAKVSSPAYRASSL